MGRNVKIVSMDLISRLKHTFLLLRGWKTEKRIVVIESDDWGSVRMPSKEVYRELLAKGVRVDRCLFSRYDSLETEEDLSVLFDALNSVRDGGGRPAILTANCVVANPDFERIRKSRFEQYHYEPMTETFKRYRGCENSFRLYHEGIKNNFFRPQFHGREHLNVVRWLEALKRGDRITTLAFGQGHFGLSSKVSPELKVRYMDALGGVSPEAKSFHVSAINEGLDLFEKLFGYRSKSFIAPCYIWSRDVELVLYQGGIRFIQGLPLQQIPVSDDPAKVKVKYHYTGQRNAVGQYYLVRNAFFEPYKGGDMSIHISDCVDRIALAFRVGKPAIISSHRINYIGSLDREFRDRNIQTLRCLLAEIVRRWPDVEFMSSDALGDEIAKTR